MARVVHERQSAEEIAAQKAARSAAYRNSQTVKNLLIALGVTLAVVLIVVFGVPRGEAPERPDIDVAAVAETVADSYGHTPLVADVPDGWGVNRAEVEPAEVVAWDVVYTPPDDTNYVTLLQGFSGDEIWAAQQLAGAIATDTMRIDGLTWDVYDIGGAQKEAGIASAIGITLSDGYVILYGSASVEKTAELAEMLTDQIRADGAAADTEGEAG